ncbi:hypothetical protein GCM10009821_18650 [Aeromicrobium halocynthiae]|uniref:Uncharacterized protein n=1 Tax=Aeromicrobium halocynthiae TaxID=560557 RepID=A0ABN2W0Q3_9ACTN
MGRLRLLALVVLPTLLVGAVIAGVLVVDALDRREQVAEADAAAERYTQQHEAFREALAGSVDSADFEDVDRVRSAVAAAREDVPTLPAVGEHGAESSEGYRFARRVHQLTETNLVDLESALDRAEEAQAFAADAERALDVDPRSFLTTTTVPSGAPVRASVIPPMQSALARFEAVEVPEGGDDAADEVSGALRFVIGEAETLARELDAGRGYQFEFGLRYGEARGAVQQYVTAVVAEVREAFDLVVGEPAGQV